MSAKAGALTANTDAPCNGGPGGNFDWIVRDRVNFDTTRSDIVGGPGGLPTATQVARRGVVHREVEVVHAAGLQRVVVGLAGVELAAHDHRVADHSDGA